MEYQKVINFWDNKTNTSSKFRTKNWVEINDGSYGRYETGSQIRFQISMLKTSLHDFSDIYMHVKL